MKASLKQLERRVIEWALAQPLIRAAIICGSTERLVNPGDAWADLDLDIYVTDPNGFVADDTWLQKFGIVWTYLQLQEDEGPVFLTLYDGGEKVDFHFFHLSELYRLVDVQQLHSAYQRGYRVVVDKDGLAARLPPALATPPVIEKPTESEFMFQVKAFWYGILYVAKQIRRRNLWVVKYRDWTIKEGLLIMMEWHAQSIHKWQSDTWNDGHFLSQWTDAQTWASLHKTFGEFGVRSSWQALLATVDLFHRLASETAYDLGYRYPTDLDDKVTTTVKLLHQDDDLSE